MNNKLTTQHPILVAIKKKGVNSLRQDVTVSLQDDGKLKIEVLMLSRTGNSGAQHNHVIPVALFLSSIKYKLERQTDSSTLFSNLCYLYGLGNINYDNFVIVRDYYKQHLSGTITRSGIDTLRIILQDYIVPLIYDSWNSRDGSVFKESRTLSESGIEGNKIRKLNTQFAKLYNNNKELDSFNDFKTEIQDFIQEYNKNIDIPNNITPQDLPKIIINARNYLEVLLNVIENSDKNAFLCGEYDGVTLLKPEVGNWHKNVLQLDKFGWEFINVHDKLKQKQPFLNEWETYLQKYPLTSSDTGTLTESDDHIDFASPRGNRDRKIEYNSKIIQQILATSTATKIEVILDTTTTAQRQDQQHISGIDKFIEKIQQHIDKPDKGVHYYLVINCISSSLVDTACLAKLSYSDPVQEWKLDVVPLVNYNNVKKIERDIEYGLKTIDVTVPGAIRYNNLDITSARVEQIVEYAKLRIKDYQILNSNNFAQYKLELDAITNAQPNTYTDQHYRDSEVNIRHLLLSPSHLSDDSDTEFVPPASHINDPQPGPSGVQSEQKRVHSDDIHLDVSHQIKKLKLTVCLSDSDRKKREASFCKFSGEDIDKFSVKRTRDIDALQIDNKRFLEYLKDSDDQAKNSQLLELVKIRQIENSDNIVDNYKYLLDQVIQDGGYNNYRQNERMQDIAYNLAKNGFSGISTNLKNTIINAAGQIQLVRGTHGTIVTCQTEGAERDCILSGLGLSYSFLSQPIEEIIKQGKICESLEYSAERMLKSLAHSYNQYILGSNTSFELIMSTSSKKQAALVWKMDLDRVELIEEDTSMLDSVSSKVFKAKAAEYFVPSGEFDYSSSDSESEEEFSETLSANKVINKQLKALLSNPGDLKHYQQESLENAMQELKLAENLVPNITKASLESMSEHYEFIQQLTGIKDSTLELRKVEKLEEEEEKFVPDLQDLVQSFQKPQSVNATTSTKPETREQKADHEDNDWLNALLLNTTSMMNEASNDPEMQQFLKTLGNNSGFNFEDSM